MRRELRALGFALLVLLIPASPLKANDVQQTIDLPRAGFRAALTAHFSITFDSSQVREDFVRLTANFLERSYQTFFDQMGFRVPAHSQVRRIEIVLAPLRPSLYGATYPRSGDRDPFITFRSTMIEDELMATAPHELFHMVSFEYDEDEDRWFGEASAVWMEDEVFPPGPGGNRYVGYPLYMDSWYDDWEAEEHLDFFAPNSDFPYGSALFLKYLTEHHPHGPALIRTMWENAAATLGSNSLEAVGRALGDPGAGGPQFREYFSKFAVAVLTKEKRPDYDFRRHREIPHTIGGLDFNLSSYHVLSLDPSGAVVPRQFDIRPLTARYFILMIPLSVTRPLNLYLSIVPRNSASKVRFALVKYNRRFPDRMEVELLGEADSRGRIFHRVSNCQPQPRHVYRLALVVSHGEAGGAPETIEFRATLAEPPYLKRVSVARGRERDLIYEARWQDGENARNLEVKENVLLFKDGEEDTVRGLRLTAVSSEEMLSGTLTARIAGQTALLRRTGISSTDRGRARIASLRVRPEDWERGFLELEMTGRDLASRELDGNPSTVARSDTPDLRWNAYEETENGPDSHIGGRDLWHHIKLEEPPPRVEYVEVRSGHERYYRGKWQKTRDPSRWKLDKKGIVREKINLEKVKRAELTVEFTGRVKNPRASLARIQVPLSEVRDGRVYRGTIPLERLRYRNWDDELPLAITAQGRLNQALDQDPGTVPRFDREGKKWLNYEPGEDSWHKLRIFYRMPDWLIRGIVRNKEGKGEPVPGARVFAGLGFYKVDQEIFERYQDLTGRMMTAYQKLKDAKMRRTTYRPTPDELEAYDQFERLKPQIREKARFFCGSDPDGSVMTDEDGIFRMSALPFPGKDGVIYAFYQFVAIKEGYSLPRGAWYLQGDYYDIRSSLDEYTLEEDGYMVPTVSLWGPLMKKRVSIEIGSPLSGQELMPPLRPATHVYTHLFKQGIDSAEIPYQVTREIKVEERTVGYELNHPLQDYLPVYIFHAPLRPNPRYPGWPAPPEIHFSDFEPQRLVPARGFPVKDFWEACWLKYQKPLPFLEGTEKRKREELVEGYKERREALRREQREKLTAEIQRMREKLARARTAEQRKAYTRALENMERALSRLVASS